MAREKVQEFEMQVPVGEVTLSGDLAIPEKLRGVVVFAHGSGSSRHSPRNRRVAQALQDGGMATLLLDLLTAREESIDARTAQLRFDIDLLARRLSGSITWALERPQLRGVRLGCFGASTGAAAALVAAAERPGEVSAVVSRGGRPDLAGDALSRVQAPTLLIVGGADHLVIGLNQDALVELRCEKQLEIVPGATHLFEEAGALDEVARLARLWFEKYLGKSEKQTRVA